MRLCIHTMVVALLLLAYKAGANAQHAASSARFTEGKLSLPALRTNSLLSPAQKSFDVLHYNLSASLTMTDAGFQGTMIITALITQQTDSLWFHSLGLIINSLKVNDSGATVVMYPASETFTVQLPRTYAPSETVTVRIDYIRDVSFARVVERQGYYWYPKGYNANVLENIGYTMSEPFDAHLWMPCFDDPTDKATCEIRVTVPNGYLAASNGLLMSTVSGDSTTSFSWKEDTPIATYLMCITASKYSTFSHYYHKVTNHSDSIEVKYFCWQADSAGLQFNAVQAFSKVTEMMRVFSTIYGEYPFEKYGMAVVYPFFYGGMEHQTMTTIHRAWLSVAGYPSYEDPIAHELSHHWWGDMVTCETFKDVWLNEGFATYSEALWREQEYGQASIDAFMNTSIFFDFTWHHAIYDPVGQGQPLFGSAEYTKAAWVLHMLRYLTGDSLFFGVLHQWRSDHLFNSANTAQFNSLVNSVTATDYNWFFNEWIYGPGWPMYAYRLVLNDTTTTYEVQIRQLQMSYPLFKMPIEVKVYSGGHDSVYVVWDSLGYQAFPLSAVVDSISFDPRNRVLKQVQPWPTAVNNVSFTPEQFALYSNYPNPFNPSTVITYTLPVRQLVTLRVYDMLGREVRMLVHGIQDPGVRSVEFHADDLPSGIYYYRLQGSTKTITKKMIFIR